MGISSEDYREFRDLLKGALTIISRYGEVLEQNSKIVLGIPVSKLPYPKEAIRLSILMWCILLQNKSLREEIIKQDYSELAEYLLSKKFYDSLKISYVGLAKFISDKEARLCDAYQQSIKKLKREVKKKSGRKNIVIDKVKGSDKISEIQKKIAKESKDYLSDFNRMERSDG